MDAATYDAIYSAQPGKWKSDMRDEFAYNQLREVLIAPPDTLLDIGCGNGHTLEYFSKRWERTRYYGIDLSSVAIGLAQEKVPGARLQAVSLMDYKPERRFEIVLALGVAEHFEDLVGGLKKVRSLVADYGMFYMEVPNNIGYSHDKTESFRPQGKQTEWFLQRSTWEEKIKESGLRVVRAIKGTHKYMEFIWILTPA